jgi:hypothetical protein
MYQINRFSDKKPLSDSGVIKNTSSESNLVYEKKAKKNKSKDDD